MRAESELSDTFVFVGNRVSVVISLSIIFLNDLTKSFGLTASAMNHCGDSHDPRRIVNSIINDIRKHWHAICGHGCIASELSHRMAMWQDGQRIECPVELFANQFRGLSGINSYVCCYFV